jgi:YggT family protein
MAVLGQLLYFLIDIYIFVIIISVVVSWLVTFNVLSPDHQATRNLLRLLGKATEPVMRPVQKYVPSIGGIDISPIIVIFGLMFLQHMVLRFLVAPLYL